MKPLAILTTLLASGAPACGELQHTHTSNLRRVWQCGDVCVRLWGNPGHRSLSFDGMTNDGTKLLDGRKFLFEWRWKRTVGVEIVATLNGKQCKELQHTYDYD
jgi:hypothetical protein